MTNITMVMESAFSPPRDRERDLRCHGARLHRMPMTPARLLEALRLARTGS